MSFLKKTVYLCGPIAGLTYGQARNGWREEFAGLLPEHIAPASPMRGKNFLVNAGVLNSKPEMYPEHVMATAHGIVHRDRNDVKNCDAVVACFLGAGKVSIGSMVEFGWADAFRKPIVTIMDADNIHQHVFVSELSGYIVPSIEEAAVLVTHLLTPGV